MNHHLRGVALGIAHGLQRAVALNFHNANGRGGCGALQLVRLFKLLECGLRFIDRFLIFLGIDARNDLISLELELRALELVFGLLHRSIVFGARNVFVRLFLGYLPHKVFVSAFLIQIVSLLRLRIEFDEDIALLHLRAGGGQLGDDHGADLGSLEPRGKNNEGTRSLGSPIEPQSLREILSFHFDDGFLDTRRRSFASEMSEQEDGHDEKEQSGRTEDEFLGLSAG